LIESGGIGGVILFHDNVENPKQVRRLTMLLPMRDPITRHSLPLTRKAGAFSG
jgi:hypothetical protein